MPSAETVNKPSTVTISPHDYDAVIFDMDGVITQTARLHARAWKQLFDEYLKQTQDKQARPFDAETDYRQYVDGKPRYEGVKSFLASRGIELPYGSPDDPPGAESVCGLGNRKNGYFRKLLDTEGVNVYAQAVKFIQRLHTAGIKTGLFSASKNTRLVLQKAQLLDCFGAIVDGVAAEENHWQGKPAPDTLLAAARQLGVEPARAVVLEDSLAGVEAAKAGGFGLVVGVNRSRQADALTHHGADAVVNDLAKLQLETGTIMSKPTDILESFDALRAQIRNRRPVVFLDYDGTLTPIVRDRDKAVLSNRMRRTLRKLAEHCTVAVVSGRDLADVEEKVDVNGLFYAGSHGFEIDGPDGTHYEQPEAGQWLDALSDAELELNERLSKFPCAELEHKHYAVTVHYRKCTEEQGVQLRNLVIETGKQHGLRVSHGKKISELHPAMDWDKGKALGWILKQLKPDQRHGKALVLYIGDDTTDEDAFRAVQHNPEIKGIGIAVQGDGSRPTLANYRACGPNEVGEFLNRLIHILDDEVPHA